MIYTEYAKPIKYNGKRVFCLRDVVPFLRLYCEFDKKANSRSMNAEMLFGLNWFGDYRVLRFLRGCFGSRAFYFANQKQNQGVKKMYSKVGKKIMTLAKVSGWMGFAGGIILWLTFLANNAFIAWFGFFIGIFSFITSWPLYGFGQLVDDVHAMRNQTSEPPIAQNDELPDL